MWEETGGAVHSTEGRPGGPVTDPKDQSDTPSDSPDAPSGRADAPDDSIDKALRALYQAHGAVLLSYLMRLTKGDRARAEDLLQETLIRAWRHPEARRADGAWSRPWLFMVARRIAIDHIRATLARPTEVGDERIEERPVEDPGLDHIADRAEIREAVRALPERLRDVIVEIYYRDHSVAKAAEILGIPEGTVKSRSYYGLRALRQELADRGYLPPSK